MSPEDAKGLLRRKCLERRRILSGQASDFGERARKLFLERFSLSNVKVVAAYLPVRGEFDCIPLATEASNRGIPVGMPVVRARDEPLIFRKWEPEMELVQGALKIPVPPAHCDVVVPDLIIAPMLAFDRNGFRLGYGGGFYDRTLASLRGAGLSVCAVGLNYADLEVSDVPHDERDEPLDWIVTEKEVVRVDSGR